MTRHLSADRLAVLLHSSPYFPDDLLNELSLDLEFEGHLNQNVGVVVPFTLRVHTLRVMECYEKHFARRPKVVAQERAWFRLFLALHDIGKPLAIEAGDKDWQHRFTVEILRRTRSFYPVSNIEFNDWIALVNGDPLGAYLKGLRSADEAGELIRAMAAQSSLEFSDFCRRLMIYYQCDVSAYTRRAKLMGALDGLFDWDSDGEIRFDEQRGILVFSSRIRELLGALGTADFNIGELT
ncbi:MAG: hypothetical protein KBD07_03740 [Candidatus Omnitrophica bacterium]|nr:hypothetical protein [Candidatus Omnitrophota bacterium]